MLMLMQCRHFTADISNAQFVFDQCHLAERSFACEQFDTIIDTCELQFLHWKGGLEFCVQHGQRIKTAYRVRLLTRRNQWTVNCKFARLQVSAIAYICFLNCIFFNLVSIISSKSVATLTTSRTSLYASILCRNDDTNWLSRIKGIKRHNMGLGYTPINLSGPTCITVTNTHLSWLWLKC